MAKATKKHTPKSASAPQGERMSGSAPHYDEFMLEDVWLNAIAEFPDTKPLADLFRTHSTPIPPDTRDFLADLLNPGDPDIYGFRLACEPTGGIDQAVKLMELAHSYDTAVEWLKETGAPDPSQVAAELVGQENAMSGRTAYRRVERWREMARKIALRLHGDR
jgi:hypothetical protein